MRTSKRTPVEVPHTEIHLVIAFKSSQIPPGPGELLPPISFWREKRNRCEMRELNNVCAVRAGWQVMDDETFIRSIHSSAGISHSERFLWSIFSEIYILRIRSMCLYSCRFTVRLRISADPMEPPRAVFFLFLLRSDIWKSHSLCLL